MKIPPIILSRSINYFIWILLTACYSDFRSHLFSMISVKRTSEMYVVLSDVIDACCYAAILAGDYHQRDGNADTYAFLSQAFKAVIHSWQSVNDNAAV